MSNLISNNYLSIAFEGLGGASEIYEYGWCYVLPRPARDVYMALKLKWGKENPEGTNIGKGGKIKAYPSYDTLELMTGLQKKADITASIQFLSLIGFLTYESKDYYDNEANDYYIGVLYTMHVLQNKQYAETILNELVKRKPYKGSDGERFNKSVLDIRQYISDLEQNKIKPLDVLGKISKKAFKANKTTMNRYKSLLQNIYNILRYSSTDEKTSYNYLLVRTEPADTAKSADSDETNRHGKDSPTGATIADTSLNNTINNQSKNLKITLDDDDSRVELQCNSSAIAEDSNSHFKFSKLKELIGFYVTEQEKIKFLFDRKITKLSSEELCLVEEALSILVENEYPSTKSGYTFVLSIIKDPDPNLAEEMVASYLKSKDVGPGGGSEVAGKQSGTSENTITKFQAQVNGLNTDFKMIQGMINSKGDKNTIGSLIEKYNGKVEKINNLAAELKVEDFMPVDYFHYSLEDGELLPF